jgi:hypothetical protein
MRVLLFTLIPIMLSAACSPSLDVVNKGVIQKRKYRPGWHVDLPRRDRHWTRDDQQPPMRVLEVRTSESVEMDRTRFPAVIAAPLTRANVRAATGPRMERSATDHAVIRDRAPAAIRSAVAHRVDPDDRPMNKLAVAGFVLAQIALFGGLSIPALAWLTIPATILGIIALVQIGKRNERGRAFAIVAALSVVYTLVVVLLLYNAVE